MVFPIDLPKGVPLRRLWHEFKIDLKPNTAPIHQPIYKLTPLELRGAKTQIESKLEHGFIRPSHSTWGALVLFVLKKDGSLRFCVDYHSLNKRTISNWYPLLLLEKMMDRLQGAQAFTKIDLRLGYSQMPIHKEDVPKTAFQTCWDRTSFWQCRLMLLMPLYNSCILCKTSSTNIWMNL